jgi:hypothetical protein
MNPTSEERVAPQPDDPGGIVSHMEPDNIGVSGLIVLFALCGVVLVLVVVLLQAWFYNWKVDLLAQRWDHFDDQQAPAVIARMQREGLDPLQIELELLSLRRPDAIKKMQIERIETYGWVDPKTRNERTIPITQAMELIVKDSSSAGAENGK